MKKTLLFLLPVIIIACHNKNTENENNYFSEDQIAEAELVESYFEELEKVLKADNGEFWNKELYGQIMVVDPESRIFYANENNEKASFMKIGGIYTDTLPLELNIANTAFEWDGKIWTMLISPLSEDKYSRINLLVHELFHRIQHEIGFDNMIDINNVHLDTKDNRILLKLELEALKKALEDENEQNEHINNAIVFRLMRYTNDEVKSAENSLEMAEGLAEYTGVMLSGRPENEMKMHFVESVNEFYENPTFVRSFAYQTIPVYGYLLSKQNKKWHQQITKTTNFTDFFTDGFGLDIPEDLETYSRTCRDQYGYEQILETEQVREEERLAKIEGYKQLFIKEPTLKLAFENMNISFDPRNITPLEDYGNVYPNLRITDNWGILTVEEGALLSNNWSNVIVSKPGQITEKLVTGKGWKLELNEEWQVKKSGESYELIKQ